MKYCFQLCILSLLLLSSCSLEQNEHVSKAVYTSNSYENKIDWSYSGETGPNNWGSLKSEYELCSKGGNQSPININTSTQKQFPLGINYHTGDFRIDKEPYSLILTPIKETNTIFFSGEQYTLKEIHFHTPSEHLINGQSSELELHFLHKSQNGKVVSIAVFVNIGRRNKEFQKLLNSNILLDSKDQITISLNIQSFIPINSQKYSYAGSLTVPPCTEGVQWIVFDKPIWFDRKQIINYQTYYSPNNRPLQSLNNRLIQKSW